MARMTRRQKEQIAQQVLSRVNPLAKGQSQSAAVPSPTAPSATYVQAEAVSMKTSVDAIISALKTAGITS